uniref:Uncharacterized protein n=1 Tax=Setaria italica TaxID=4555 RepID=K3ZYU8_SETIT
MHRWRLTQETHDRIGRGNKMHAHRFTAGEVPSCRATSIRSHLRPKMLKHTSIAISQQRLHAREP